MKYFYTAVAILSLYACHKNDSSPASNENNGVFYSANRIFIPPYHYSDDVGGHPYTFSERGDSAIYPHLIGGNTYVITPDLHFANPTFTWSPTGLKYVAMGIFDEPPVISKSKGDTIQNKDHMMWTWNNSMPHGVDGNVRYTNGVLVDHGVFLDTPTSLFSVGAKSYYWIVWGWDDNGLNVIYSSQAVEFLITLQ